MSRYRICALVGALLVALAIGLGHPALCWWVGAALVILTGFGVAFPQMSFFRPFICRGRVHRRQVALTFDDGPDARSTPALLDLLRHENIPAAFFCIGKRASHEHELTARINREGHLLGNHTFNHSNLTNFFGPKRLQTELQRTQDSITAAAGTTPQCFRPPMGLSNPFIFHVTKKLDLTAIGWTIRSLDTRLTDPERVVQRVVERLAPGAIILLHDGNMPADRLVRTVKSLLVKLREQGYEVVRLDKLLA